MLAKDKLTRGITNDLGGEFPWRFRLSRRDA